MSEEQTKMGPLGRFSAAVDGFFQTKFHKWGFFVGSRPKTTIGLAFLLFLVCCAGFAAWEEESRPEKLWVPNNTEAQEDFAKYQALFPAEARRSYVIVEAAGGGSVLDTDVLLAAMELHADVEAIVVEDAAGAEYAYEDVCVLAPGDGHPCLVSGVLGLWNYSAALLAADSDPLATINANIDPDDWSSYFGGAEEDGDGDLASAEALMLTYINKNNEEVVGSDYVDVVGEAWEAAWLDLMQTENDDLVLYPEASSSLFAEFGSAITGDVILINISFMVMFFYLSFGLGKPCNRVNSRYWLALAGLLCVGLAIGASYGLSSGLGFYYTPLHSVLPFVLLGLGVDDSFVIANAFDQVPKDLPVAERTARALSHAAVSITVTSVTDFVAFLISTTSSLGALSSFCFYAAIGILFLFLFQISFFSAFLAIDAQRAVARRADCCPCCFVGGRRPAKGEEGQSAAAEEGTPAPNGTVGGGEEDLGKFNKFLRDKYGPAITTGWVRIAIIVGFAGLLAAGAAGTAQLSVEDATRSFIPDGSYLLDTLDKVDEYFGEIGSDVYIVTEDFDYFANQENIAAITTALAAVEDESPYIQDVTGSTYNSWYDDYLDYVALMNTYGASISVDSDGRPTDEAEFYAHLRAYTSGMGYQYNSSLVFDGTTQGGLSAARIQAQYKSFTKYRNGQLINDADKQIAAMDDLRAIVDEWDIDAFPWSYDYLDWETFKVIQKELTQGLALCLVAVFLITCVLIAHPGTAFLVVACVGATVVDIMGAMYYWGLVIDNVSVIYLVLAVGLAVDYAAHIAHSFMLKQGSRPERVCAALGDIGSAVLNGAASTFLAVALLGLSASYVFRVMFKVFFVTVAFGVGHGAILLPALLSLVGPAAYAPHGAPAAAAAAAAEEKSVSNSGNLKQVAPADVEVEGKNNNEAPGV